MEQTNSNLDKEFVPYGEASELTELGFNEPCFKMSEHKKICDEQSKPEGCQLHNLHCGYPDCTIDKSITPIPLPTFSQAFRWFRDNHNLGAIVSQFGYAIENQYGQATNFELENKNPLSYEESELECLKKLIQIAKPQSHE